MQKKSVLSTILLIAILSFVFVACNNSVDFVFDNQPSYPRDVPLTLEFPTAGSVTITKTGDPGTVLYSLDGGLTKTEVEFDTPIDVPADGKISFYRTLSHNLDHYNYFTINCDETCYAYGNVMSLIDSENFETATDVFGYSFYCLFKNNASITNHPSIGMILQATTLAYSCYQNMFFGCTGLEKAPLILATTLADDCCHSMFNGCSNLKEAPKLLATTMAFSCYEYMFEGCISLKKAPRLPATTLADSCYESMFEDCISLENAPDLPATTLAEYCYEGMFAGCTSLGRMPNLPATSLERNCYFGMFADCTSLTTVPAKLPATELAYGCYGEMFSGCTGLTTAPLLPAATLEERSYDSMFSGCTSLSSITCLATDISAEDCTAEWVEGVAPTGTFYKNPEMTGWTSVIPSGWTVHDYPMT